MFRIFNGAKKGCWIKRWCQDKAQHAGILCNDKQLYVGQDTSPQTNDVPSRSFYRYAHNPKEEQHQDDNDHYEENDQHDNKKAEQEWFQRVRCFQHDVCSDQHPFHFLGVVGWGTAIITGLRITRERYDNRQYSDKQGSCWVTRLQHFASSVLHQQYDLFQIDARFFGLTTTIRNVLPLCTTGVKPLPVLPEEEVVEKKNSRDDKGERSGLLACGEQTKWKAFNRPIDVTNRSPKFAEPPIKESYVPIDGSDLDEALHKWQEVAQLYTAVYENAEGIRLAWKGNFVGAVKFWSRAAYSSGYAKAYFNLGICHQQGIGVEQDLEKAKICYTEAATRGHAMAGYNLAMICLSSHSDLDLAMKELQKAADLGLKHAQRELGVLYTELPRRDMKKAASLFQQASSQKDARSTYFLGICYENGWGVERSETKAGELYRQSAVGGCIDAANSLGRFFDQNGFSGSPVDKDMTSIPANSPSQDSVSTENSSNNINIFSRHDSLPTESKSSFLVDVNKVNSESEDFNSDWDSISDSSQSPTREKHSPSLIHSDKDQNMLGLDRNNPLPSARFGSVSSEDEGFEAGEPSAIEKLHRSGGKFGF